MADLTGKTLGNYEIIKMLGKGGMAVVYLARQVNMKREVAVKVIESDLAQSAEFVRRFEREVDTIASFSNAHILKVFDYGKDEGLVYLVMELLRGGSLADKIRAGAMPLSTVRKLLNQIASALDYAHRRGIVHRDLKPQNVMLDEDGNAFLTDFGIAKVMSGGTTITMATSAGTILGTPAYMAPEQWKSQPVDARTDIYALGIMLYEMLTGSLPFNSDTAYGLMHKHVNEAPPIRTMERRFASGIERVLLKALEKNPDDRYSSSMQLVREFEAAIQRHGLGESPYADAATQSGDGEIELIELEPINFDDTFAKRPVDSDLSRPISSPMSDTHLKTGTLSLKPEAAAPPPATPAATPAPQSRSSVPLIIGLLVLLGLGGIGAVLLTRGGSTPTPTTPPTAVVLAATDTATSTPTIMPSDTTTPTITPTATNTDEPGVQTQVALTLTERATQTLIVQASFTKTATPNRQQTAAAQIAQLDTATSNAATANAIASYTKTPTSTATATNTATATYTATATFTNTATATATFTATLTLTPVPCVISTTKANNVSFHIGPSRNRTPLGFLTASASYTASRQSLDERGNLWVEITFDNRPGWVMLSDVTSSGDCANLPSFEATATPTPTFTVTRTLTPSITPPPGAVCLITTTQENVRAHLGPSRQRTPIGFLAPNTPYAPLSRATDSDGNKWVEITLTLGTRNQQLWVMLSDVTVQGDCDQLPSAGASTQGNTGATSRATFASTPTIQPSVAPSSTPSLTSTVTNTATVAASATRTSTSTATTAASMTQTPSPSATATVIATTGAALSTVSATQSGACTITTTAIDTRVHLGPSRLRNVMGNLKANTPYTVISRVVDADKKVWVEVKLNTKQGWVFLEDVAAQGNCDRVPTPTATVAK